MAKISINEVIEINAPLDAVYEYLLDFKNWHEWSPWIICEPDCQLDYAENSYSWEGKVVGAGVMRLIDSHENKSTSYDLEFLKPWKSHSSVQFDLSATSKGTNVSWKMQSSLPWYLFWMKSMMSRLISMDYERGLKMLKEQLETGAVDSQLEYNQRETIEGCHYVGIRRTCPIDDMDTCMREDIDNLVSQPIENKSDGDPPFTIYEKWKLGKGIVTYMFCIPVKEKLENMEGFPDRVVSGYRPPCDAYTVTHTGDYKHLGNAWTSAMMRSRSKEFAQSRKIMPFEIYVTDPNNLGSDEKLITKVCLPLK